MRFRLSGAVVGAVVAIGLVTAGCTQNDVQKADSAFHQVAQGTHDVGDKMAQGAKQVGHDVNQKVKHADQKASQSEQKAKH